MNSAPISIVLRRGLNLLTLVVQHPWAVLLLLSLTISLSATAQVPLTEEEQDYIHAHPIVPICVNPEWLPFAGIDNNQKFIGIFSDLLNLIVEKTGLKISVYPTQNWDKSLAASRNGDCLAIIGLNQTPDREQWLIFTDTLLEDPNVLITREDHPYISDLRRLENKTLALTRGTATSELVARDFPNLMIFHTQTEAESMQLVSDGKVDLTIGSLAVAAHTIANAGWYNLQISGRLPGYENRSRIGVIKSEKVLRNILNHGLAEISDAERQRIMERHLSLRVLSEAVIDYTLAYWLGILLLAVIGTSLFWMRRLNAVNNQLRAMAQTDALTQLTNRHGLNLTLEKDLERSRRYQHPLSVIMMDIDHFKRINDQFGHLVGDKVLMTCAMLLKDNLRKSDIICRWGGEEFLVLCFDTNQAQATKVAELLLEKIRQYNFPQVGTITLSAGVTQAIATDNAETFTERADKLLYQAKNNGRDQVCVDLTLVLT